MSALTSGGSRRLVLPGIAIATTIGLGLAQAGPAAASTTFQDANARPVTNAAPAATSSAMRTPVTGNYTDSVGGPGHFKGTFSPDNFFASNRLTRVTGVVRGTATNSLGKSYVRSDRATFFIWAGPSTATQGTAARGASLATPAITGPVCKVLNLVLGPLHINLLGLVINLNRVHLVINAIPGAGNLLGNLLCAVAGLLDGGVTPGIVALILNRILAILQQVSPAAAAKTAVYTA